MAVSTRRLARRAAREYLDTYGVSRAIKNLGIRFGRVRVTTSMIRPYEVTATAGATIGYGSGETVETARADAVHSLLVADYYQ